MATKKFQDEDKTAPTIVWLRQDLRIADQPALFEAARRGGPVLPVYIWAPQEEHPWEPGGASRVWLHFSLKALADALEKQGSRLFVFNGRSEGSAEILRRLCRHTGARAVHWNRRYEPAVIERDKAIKADLKAAGIAVETFKGALMIEPWEILTKQSSPYQVFTPYWRNCSEALQGALSPRPPLAVPEGLALAAETVKRMHSASPAPVKVEGLSFLPDINWYGGICRSWVPGEAGGRAQLQKFLQEGLASYREGRDRPAMEGVSRLSPHLHFGELSPQAVWQAVVDHASRSRNHKAREAAQAFLRELGWREFSHHILYHFPHTSDKPLRPAFAAFPWGRDREGFKAWSRGLTGYPIVDAGMRELWETGIMHNRVRMIAASFLVKDLLIPWQEGACWFWDTLVDADLAQNSMGWQWTAGCGADAAPYFRIFNPVLQAEKFDPDGDYVRRWVPELSGLPPKWIHKPWQAPPAVLQAAGVDMGGNYPRPIVDHTYARNRALAAFKELKDKDIAEVPA